MTNFSDFVKKTFGLEKEENNLKLVPEGDCYTRALLSAADQTEASQRALSVIRYLPTLKQLEGYTPDQKKRLTNSINVLRSMYLKDRKHTDDVLYHLNEYLRKCV